MLSWWINKAMSVTHARELNIDINNRLVEILKLKVLG